MSIQDTRLPQNMAGEEGFEPSLRDPESRVLPLDDSPKNDARRAESSPLAVFLCGLLPSNFLKKTAEIGQEIQSFLPNPPRPMITPPAADINIARRTPQSPRTKYLILLVTVLGFLRYMVQGGDEL